MRFSIEAVVAGVKGFFKRRGARTAALITGGILILTTLLGVGDTIASWQSVHPRVDVNGVSIGGMTKTEAREALKRRLELTLKRPVVVEYKGKRWSIDPKNAGFTIDYAKTIENAYSVGRQDGTLASFGERVSSWFAGREIRLVYKVDEKVLNRFLDEVEGKIGKKSADAMVTLKDNEFVVADGKPGYEIDRKKALPQIRNALTDELKRKVVLELRAANPEINLSQAKAAADSAEEMVTSPVALGFKESKWTLERVDLATLIDFSKMKKGKGFSYEPVFSKERFGAKLDALTANVLIEPKNARFEVEGDKVRVVPGENGRKVDVDEAYEALNKSIKDKDRKIYLSMKDVEPELTTDEAKAYGIETKLASFTTEYNPNATARVNNIHVISDAIDGAVVAPGETFSVNEHVGPRTADKGYLEAPVIVNGRLEQGIGGGICQVATTLFNSAFFSGLDIVERVNHAFYISNYPAGLDATVSYGGPDLKFRNDTGSHILIKFFYTNNSVTAAIYGKDGLNTDVSYSTTAFSNFSGFPTTTIEDPSLPKGTTKTVVEGVTGRDITAYRTVKRNGQVVHEDTFFSSYDPEPAVIKVGTGGSTTDTDTP